MAVSRYRREAAVKLLTRILTHPAFTDGLPVRFRCDPLLTVPIIRCNRFTLSVWLPTSLARYIPLLSAFIRSMRRKQTVKVIVRVPPRNGNQPNSFVPQHKPVNGTRPKGKGAPTKQEKPKQKPVWQREWDALWDKIAQALFGNETLGMQDGKKGD